VPEKNIEKKGASKKTPDAIEKNNLKKFKLIDGLCAYALSLAMFACAYGFLKNLIGVWAIYLACILSATAVFVLVKLTGLRSLSVFKFSSPKKLETVGCSLALASVIVVSMPLILLSQLIAPGLALTSFNVYSVSNNTFSVILLTVLLAICENILFDGYIYSRFKVIDNLTVRAVVIALMASAMKLDLYALPCVFVASLACFMVRRFTDSLVLPLVLRICSSMFVTAMSAASAGSSELLGEAMGGVQVTGMSLIFLGIACPCVSGALGAFGRLGGRGKTVGIITGAVAIILVAVGSGISSL
jgi:hypothetical protein